MKIKFSERFVKQYEKANKKIRNTAKKRLEVFRNNPLHLQLRNHSLSGKLAKYRSINITGDWRALYSDYIDAEGERVVLFEMLGTHSQLYK